MYNLESKGSNERSNNSAEKDARATIYAAVKRILSDKDIVILDGGNYIKGWRYQLFCEAKAVRTPSCVVHIGTPVGQAKGINESRLSRESVDNAEQEQLPYEAACWENLVYRYEEPNAMARWDSPLFTVLWDDKFPPSEDIWDALIGSDAAGKKTVRPNQATVMKAPTGQDFLYELDKSTQAILGRILEWSKDHPGEGGGEVIVKDHDTKEELVIDLPANPVGLPALQRLRRQFISLNRQNAVPAKRIRESFVSYLNDSFAAG